MKTLIFKVEITFSDKIVDDNEINEISANIADSLVHEADTIGIVPENCEGFTEQINVSNSITGTLVTRNVI